ncbi:MAG: hypothetical protein ABI611_19400, partial [Solirubrobacteraceae bacterium]
ALDALELRGTELEERVAALAAERDALAEQARALEQQVPRDERQRRALADALAAAAAARREAREWRLRMRTAEVARTSDSVRLRVLEGREVSTAPLRTERAEQAAALEVERGRAQELTAAALRARRQAMAAAADLDEVRRDMGRRLDAGARSAAEWEGRATEAESALGQARGELSAREAELADARTELERVRTAVTELSADLEAERVSRAAAVAELSADLEAERAARSVLSDALDAETDALASLHVELNAERAARAADRGELDDERAARAAEQGELEALRDAGPDPGLQEELDRERGARHADQSALAALRDDLAAERAAATALREEVARDTTAELRAEMESGREADRAVVASLRADLNTERAARERDRAELASLRAELEAAQSRLTEAGAADEGGLLDRVAGLADEIEFQRRAREQAEAAAAHVPDAGSRRVVADLDAAASALRERAGNGMAVGSAATPAEDAVPAAAPPERARRDIVSAPRPPKREHATGRSARQYPWLRGALVKLAHDDPETAGRIIAGLLPVQAVIVQGPVDYDLTITEIGTFSISLNSGRAYVQAIAAPRGRREAEFHLSADALTLAELIAGVPHRIGRFRGPARVSGRKRRTKPLQSIRTAGLSLAEAARAGARLDPGLVFRTFPYVVHPAWSRHQSFTVAQQILGDPPETWYLVVGNGRGMRVLSSPPEEGADATVTMTPEAFGHLLRGEPVPAGHRPSIRGDRAAVALLKRWLDRAQGL